MLPFPPHNDEVAHLRGLEHLRKSTTALRLRLHNRSALTISRRSQRRLLLPASSPTLAPSPSSQIEPQRCAALAVCRVSRSSSPLVRGTYLPRLVWSSR